MDPSSAANRLRSKRIDADRGEQAYAKPVAIAQTPQRGDVPIAATAVVGDVVERLQGRRRCLVGGLGMLASTVATPVLARRTDAVADDRFAVAGTTAAQVRPFLASLQKAVGSDDRRAVTRMFFYPSRIWVGDRSETVLRRSDVSDRYDTIFDKSLRRLIADAHWDTLFANWRGVALGNGRLWFARITTQDRLAITAINGPAGAQNQ